MIWASLAFDHSPNAIVDQIMMGRRVLKGGGSGGDNNISNIASSAIDNFGNPSSSSHSISADVAISIADSVDQPSISEEPHNKKPRLLARYNTEEAVAKAFGTIDE